MKYTKICKCCGQPFETNNPQKEYCDREHYLPCPICGTPVLKKDRDFTRPPKCCSSKCTHELRKRSLKPRKCIFCGEMFYPKSGASLVCDKEHTQPCEICGKPIPRKIGSTVTTCSDECLAEKLKRNSLKKYGTEHPMQSPAVQKRFHNTLDTKYGYRHSSRISGFLDPLKQSDLKSNIERSEVQYVNTWKQYNDSVEHLRTYTITDFSLEDQQYDVCISDYKTLIEFDLSATHNIAVNPWGETIDTQYHLMKTELALKYGYRCVHVFDWDDWDKIAQMFLPKERLYARKMKIYRLDLKVTEDFLDEFHLQGSVRGQLLCLGLVQDGTLYQVMTFGKSRYDKSHYVELLRLCTRPGFTVVGGASRLYSYATSEYGLHKIISYCDRSKFIGGVYGMIGMNLVRRTPPQIIWSKEDRKITANLLRQRGYDQLFGTHYGKGSNNEQLMLENGWLPVCDCGQLVFGSVD